MRAARADGVLLALGVALLGAAPAPPAVSAFADAWAKVPSYTCTIRVHETKGAQVQDRTYRYAFLKPHFAKIDIVAGPGRGGGAVWKGGTTIVGHRGGAISFIRLTRPLNDPEAADLRGHTMDQASFQAMLDALRDAPSLTEATPSAAYDAVEVPYKDADGATRRELQLSKTTHLPVRRLTYAGDAVVEDETFVDVNTAANLKESDF